jgi:hypothetical protein
MHLVTGLVVVLAGVLWLLLPVGRPAPPHPRELSAARDQGRGFRNGRTW